MPLRRPGAGICSLSLPGSEKMKISTEAMDQLVEAAQADIRLVINMLSTWNLSKKTMDFDEGKEMCVRCVHACMQAG